MNGKILLDINIIIGLFAGDGGIQKALSDAPEVFLSIIVLGELIYGALRSFQTERNLNQINELANGMRVLPCDRETARYYGLIKNQLRQVGRPIPENDIWVAATARQHNLCLLSRDKHFNEIEGLFLAAY
jgi:tRNA(fMet)-specific endonuclease VapC